MFQISRVDYIRFYKPFGNSDYIEEMCKVSGLREIIIIFWDVGHFRP